MKTYAVTILSVLAFSALAATLAPKGRGEKGVRFALSVLILFSLISPLLKEGLPDLVGSDDFEAAISSLSAESIEAGSAYYEAAQKEAVTALLTDRLCRDFGVDRAHIALDLSLHYDEPRALYVVRHIRLHLHGVACLADAQGMLTLLSEQTQAECEVIYHRA